jgi:hypothetical protein
VPGEEAQRAGEPRDNEKLLPDETADDTDAGWGERRESNDQRLIEDRPPHWG